jgi:asparagine synthase (glutamine-hydrolysing)
MCGIAGFIHHDRTRPADPARLQAMLDAIRHRGPDDDGAHVEGPVALGMRRLSIIDLAGGHQPIYDESRRRVLVFNGEIYNYRDLRAGLTSRGHRLATASDTETIVHLHEEVGPDCVQPLRGMFGFALWDSEQRELLLARDRFGIKPLYVSIDAEGISFASELKALHAGGFVRRELDWEALEGLFRVGYVAAPRTPFKGVQKLEPGHVLTWRPSTGARVRRYWDVPTEAAHELPHAEEEVRQRLDESVRAHLVSDVPVAAFLSGGLDSSSVVASMALAGGTVHAFTARYEGSGADDADETGLARALADRYSIDLTVVPVEPRVDRILQRIVSALDEPLGDESVVPTWLLCEEVARHYKVALVGTGGDELFGGYRRHLGLAAALQWQRVPAGIRRAVSRGARMLPEPAAGGLGVTRLKRFLGSSGASLPALYLSLQNRMGPLDLFTEDIRAEIATGYTQRAFERHALGAPVDGSVRPALYLDYKTYLPEDLLHLADRISMAHSLELRTPFVDHELVEKLFPMPDATRIGRGRPKRILREAQRERLTPAHFTAPKRGFVGPTAMWLRNELADVLADELAPDRIKELGYFDHRVIDRIRAEHAARQQNHESVLWTLLCFSTWHREVMEGTAAPAHRV